MKKRDREIEEAGCPVWMVTFGDTISLLVTFFVMLITFTNMEQEKLMDMIGSMKGALGITSSLDIAQVPREIPQRVGGMSADPKWLSVSELSAVLPDATMAVRRFGKPKVGDERRHLLVRMVEEGMTFIISSDPVFEKNSATLMPGNEEMLTQIGSFVGQFENEIRVIGVVGGSRDEPRGEYRTPESLGIARAWAVIDAMKGIGRLADERFALGCKTPANEIETVILDGERVRLPDERIEILVVGHRLHRDVSPTRVIVKDRWR